MKKFLSLGFLIAGVLSGILLYHARYHCLEINFSHHPFYGQFAQELKKNLRKRGYYFRCPAPFPKTIIYFNQTDYNMPKPQIDHTARFSKHILFNGDCIQNIDFNYFKQFDAVLNTNELFNAYLAFYNLPTAHFPLTDDNRPLCRTDYQTKAINLKDITKRLDSLIQGINHDTY